MKSLKHPSSAFDYWWAWSPHEDRWVLMVVAPTVLGVRHLLVRYASSIHGWPLWFLPDWRQWKKWIAVKEPKL